MDIEKVFTLYSEHYKVKLDFSKQQNPNENPNSPSFFNIYKTLTNSLTMLKARVIHNETLQKQESVKLSRPSAFNEYGMQTPKTNDFSEHTTPKS